MPERLKSRKFWITTLASIAVVLITAVFDVPEEQAQSAVAGIVSLATGYNVSQGYADGQKERAK